MAWFKREKAPLGQGEEKKVKVPEGLWSKCPSCGEIFPKNDFGMFYATALDKHGAFRRSLSKSRGRGLSLPCLARRPLLPAGTVEIV